MRGQQRRSRRDVVFAIGVISLFAIMGILAAIGLNQAAAQAQSPFSVVQVAQEQVCLGEESSGLSSQPCYPLESVHADWSNCVVQLDGHMCQTQGGTWWSFKTTTENLTFTQNAQVTKAYLFNQTAYHEQLTSIGCASNANYYEQQQVLQAAQAKYGMPYNPSGDYQIDALTPTALVNVETMFGEQTQLLSCFTLNFGRYIVPTLDLTLATVNDPATNSPVLNSVTLSSDAALNTYHLLVALTPSERTISVTLTETYTQTTITKNGAIFSQTDYNPNLINTVVNTPKTMVGAT